LPHHQDFHVIQSTIGVLTLHHLYKWLFVRPYFSIFARVPTNITTNQKTWEENLHELTGLNFHKE